LTATCNSATILNIVYIVDSYINSATILNRSIVAFP